MYYGGSSKKEILSYYHMSMFLGSERLWPLCNYGLDYEILIIGVVERCQKCQDLTSKVNEECILGSRGRQLEGSKCDVILKSQAEDIVPKII